MRTSIRLIWQQKTISIRISPSFSKCPRLGWLEELHWHLFCLLLKGHRLQFRRDSYRKVQHHIVLKSLPFLSTFRLLHSQWKRRFLNLETFWSTKRSRKSTGDTNSPRHWDSRDRQGAELLPALGGQRGKSVFNWEPKFCTGSPTHEATENSRTWESKSRSKVLLIQGDSRQERNLLFFLLFAF